MDSYVTGTAIRQLREAKHLTQAELAEKLAVSAKGHLQSGRQPADCPISPCWSRWRRLWASACSS